MGEKRGLIRTRLAGGTILDYHGIQPKVMITRLLPTGANRMQRRIILSVCLSILTILLSLGVLSYVSVNDSIQRSLENRLTLADLIGRFIDYFLESNLRRLQDISIAGKIDFDDGDWGPEKRAIRTAYEYSIFTDRIFLLDVFGNVVLTYPHQEGSDINLLSIPYVSKTLREKRPYVSDVYTMERTGRKVIFALVPLKDKNGEFVGAAGGEVDPANYLFTQILKTLPTDRSTVVELVDSHGIIIASNRPERILTCSDHNRFLGKLIARKKSSVGLCHRCHVQGRIREGRTKDMLALAPLSLAPWGVTVREPQEVVFAPSTLLRRGFFLLSLVAAVTSVLLALGLSRSIVRPLKTLSEAALRIGRGNLGEPVEITGKDEVGALARSFDRMRTKLAESHHNIRRQNEELERRVLARTKALAQSRRKLAMVLQKVITAQEEERKRIARELHDDTSQSLNAILMSLDALAQSPGGGEQLRRKVKRLREQCLLSLHGLHAMIQDLRPPVLDDLGFESAVRWVLARHLGEKGVRYVLEIEGSCTKSRRSARGLLDCGRMELLLFRVLQEAVTNIARHAEARNVYVFLGFAETHVEILIEDDGKGFDVDRVTSFAASEETPDSFGILGMQERIALMDGRMTLCSRPGRGTQLAAYVPA